MASVLEDAVLLVSELVSNSARHATTPSGAAIRVRGRLDGDVVRLHVLDRGQRGSVAVRAPAEDGVGGHGLRIVAAVARDWGVRHGLGTEVWFELSTGRANGGPAPPGNGRR